MALFWTILLSIIGIILFIGIIRVIVKRPRDIGDFFMDLLLLDLMGDMLEGVIDAISDIDWD